MKTSEYVLTIADVMTLRKILDLPDGSTTEDIVDRVRILKEERDDRHERWQASAQLVRERTARAEYTEKCLDEANSRADKYETAFRALVEELAMARGGE